MAPAAGLGLVPSLSFGVGTCSGTGFFVNVVLVGQSLLGGILLFGGGVFVGPQFLLGGCVLVGPHFLVGAGRTFGADTAAVDAGLIFDSVVFVGNS